MMNLSETNKVIKAFEKEIKRLLKLGKSPKEAVKAAYKKYPVMEALREELDAQIVTEMARGSEYAFPEEVLQAAAASVWAADGLTLSQRTTRGSKIVTSYVGAVIASCLKENQTVYAASKKIFDGYKKSGIIPEQDIPEFMRRLIRINKDMQSEAEFKRVLRSVKRNVEKLSTQGMRAAYYQIIEAIQAGNEKRLDNAIYVATQERTRYFAERIARTELARAYHDGVTARWDNDPDCVAYKWRMSQSHPVTDICDLYAGADLYGMGAGIFPKGKVPELPAHPHCMCYLRPLMDGSLHLKSQTPVEQVNKGGKEWLDKQAKTVRQNILGVMGESRYQKGGNWESFARGYGHRYMKSRVDGLAAEGAFFDDFKVNEFKYLGVTPQGKELDTLKFFEKRFLYLPYENAIIVAKDGRTYYVKGGPANVNINVLDPEILAGAYMTHNHPVTETRFSFSSYDLGEFFKHKFTVLRGVDTQYEYQVVRAAQTLDEEYDKVLHRFSGDIYYEALDKAKAGTIDMDDSFHEVNKLFAEKYRYDYRRTHHDKG